MVTSIDEHNNFRELQYKYLPAASIVSKREKEEKASEEFYSQTTTENLDETYTVHLPFKNRYQTFRSVILH